ncbi:MAG: hypothetical protein GYB65_08935 [Chloroflexi bacterium]|nr:hypothetical protein [Chloroflexota bacterium]
MGFDMDELRSAALDDEVAIESIEPYLAPEVRSDKLFGMTAVERMFLSVGCFILTSLGGFVILLVLEKIAL